MLKRDDIIQFIKVNKPYLEKHFHIKKIGIIGSYARNEQTESSDLDLIIELEDNISSIYELKNELRNYIFDHLKLSVDIAREKYLKSYVKEDVMKEAIYVE